MFKRRTKRSYAKIVAEGIYPRGGWSRAASYMVHRLRRLPDPPHKIARGVAAGVFVCFTPVFGFHFLLAAILSFVMQGNILAALMATFFGNPLTFPVIAAVSIELGSWMLGTHGDISLPEVFEAFYRGSFELWGNIAAVFTDDVAHWGHLRRLYAGVFMPYLVGGIIPGVFVSVLAYMITLPLITVYQKNRIKRLKKRYEKKRAAEAAKAAEAARIADARKG